MYAIIRTGGKQAKVREGDVIDVERLRAEGEVTFTPLLFVGDDGTVISDRESLKQVRVVGRILGGSAGPKVDIFKYKAKTGYRRRQGHRQKYTTVEVTAIEAPGAKRTEKADEAAEESAAASGKTAEKSPASKPAASKPKTSASTTTKKASAGAAASEEATKTPAKRSSKSTTATKKPTTTTKKSTTTTKKSTTTTKKTSTAKKPASKKES
jgi:large subunit ribosomal protein L21